MGLTRNKLYLLLILACLAGFIWLLVSSHVSADSQIDHPIGACLIKRVTDIPCPSCGATRSIRALFHGDFASAIYWNPFGIIIFLIMSITPVWIGYDLLKKQSTFFRTYLTIERWFQKKWVIILTILLVVSNWVWNIQKGL